MVKIGAELPKLSQR